MANAIEYNLSAVRRKKVGMSPLELFCFSGTLGVVYAMLTVATWQVTAHVKNRRMRKLAAIFWPATAVIACGQAAYKLGAIFGKGAGEIYETLTVSALSASNTDPTEKLQLQKLNDTVDALEAALVPLRQQVLAA